MNTTYTLTEGNEALNRVILMMHYDLNKTSIENIVLEQPDEKFDTPYNKELMREYQKKIEAPTLSEALLELREFLYDPIGITTQVVLSIAGAEIGLPIVFQLLDGAIIVNDAYIMVRDWDSNGPKLSVSSGPMGDLQINNLWEWFEFHYTRNIGFQYLCIDVLAVTVGFGVMGLGKMVTKSAKNVFKLLIEKFGKNFPGKIAEFLDKFKPKTDSLPKKVGTWVERKMSEIKKAIDLLKTPKEAAISVLKPKKLVLAGVSGYGAYKLAKWFEKNHDVIYKFFNDNPEEDEVVVTDSLEHPTTQQLINMIIKENPKLFKQNFKPKSFKVQMVKLDNNQMYPKYYIIDNIKYSPVDLTKGLEIKKI
jgi:hypothetical protein